MWRSILCALVLLPASLLACPDLTPFYPGSNPDWAGLRVRLQTLVQECLQSSEYFALLGAAQLNSGQPGEALDSLERALLLDPINGAAQIDYAEALLVDGQLFAALEINNQILDREDLPEDLGTQLQSRQRRWRRLTRQTQFQFDTLAGYDDNLNGAPDADLIELTLSGESVLLPLDQEFQSVGGPYLNLRSAVRHRRLNPDSQHNFTADVRTRISDQQDSDLLQATARYGLVHPGESRSWQLSTGLNHLFFGGSPLLTATDLTLRYQLSVRQSCADYLLAAAQHQIWHNQTRLDGVEAKLGLGANCSFGAAGGQRLNAEFNVLGNQATQSNRPGEDRLGWQFGVSWQLDLADALVRAQYAHTMLLDAVGYSPILAAGARRRVDRDSLLVSYQEPLPWFDDNAVMLINLFIQSQRSNLELFGSRGTTLEFGFSWRF